LTDSPLVDLEAERILLGALIVSPSLLDAVGDVVKGVHFSLPLHRWCYEAIGQLVEAALEINLVTVRRLVEVEHELTDLERGAVHALVDGMPRVADATGWGRKVRESARRREALAQLRKACEELSDGVTDTDEALGRASMQIQRLTQASDAVHTFGSEEVAKRSLARLEAYSQSETGLTGISTPIRQLDDLTGGWQDGSLYVIAARPARGKSVFCAQSVLHAGMAGKRCLSFTLEMPPEQVMERLLLGEAQVDKWALRHSRKLEAWDRLGKAFGKCSSLPVQWDNRESPTLAAISATARRVKAQHGLDLLVVDYLQRCSVDRKFERYAAIGELIRGLKGLARNMNIPVIVAAQVSRAGQEARPTLSMLREAGDIENEADLVAFLHPADGESMDKDEAQVDFLVEKNRHGATQTIQLTLERRYTRFRERIESEVMGVIR
jgi:replicative DNA helicase